MKKNEKDLFRVWLTLRSSTQDSGDDIATTVKMAANTAPLRTKQGAISRKSFSLQSDLEIREFAPLEDHVVWLKNRCANKLEDISAFLSKDGNYGEISIYVTTNQNAAYVDMPSADFSDFISIGLDISVKFEVDNDIE